MGPLALIPWRVWLYGGLVIAALGTVAFYHHKWYDAGKNAAVTEINKANEEALANALKAQTTVDDCYAHGGVWDRDLGVCGKPAGK